MADPNELKKIDVDLVKTAILDFAYYVALAKDGNPPVAMLLNDLLRQRPELIQDGTGGGTEIVDFTDDSLIQVTIDQNTTIDIENVPDKSTNYLRLKKGSANIATFIGDLGFQEIAGVQHGRSDILYEITTATTSGGNKIILKQVDNQKTGAVPEVNISITSAATISSFDYFDYSINNNICTVNFEFDIQSTGTPSSIAGTISGFNVLPIRSTPAAATAWIVSVPAPGIYVTQAYLSNTNFQIQLSTNLTVADVATIRLTTQFEVI
jgi:hypothetical protein